MNYQQTISYLFSTLPVFERTGANAYKADLTNTIRLCNLLGNPQNDIKTIHIAGTNGKGSTSHMLASILQEKGWKVGLYTSPHLKDFRERILINGNKIPKAYITGFVRQYFNEIEKIDLSFFELTVGLAFKFFSESKVDIAVIEVGLGGRLDSTNIITPLISVITNISFDHMQFLGNTLEKIASEKAGIIKPNVPVVIGETQAEIRHVFTEKSKETGSDLLFADSLFSLRKNLETTVSAGHLSVNVMKDQKLFLKDLVSPLSGFYQLKNIVTVLGVIEMLGKRGIPVTMREIKRGIRKVIKNTHLSGRWQILSFSPLTICDTGHNEAGLTEVTSQINSISYGYLHFVFGVVKDKAIDKILAILPKNATYYFCNAATPRALNAGELKVQANLAGLAGESYSSVSEALKSAQTKAGTRDLIFIGGSTFVVAEVI